MSSLDIASIIDETGKFNFDEIYHALDPREYFRVLVGLDYVIPDLAKAAFRSLIKHREAIQDHSVKIVDVGSSYGINSAVINHSLDIKRLASRYAEPAVYSLPTEELMARDRHYFASWPKLSDARFVGVDTSSPAVSYAQAVGLLDGAVTTNLEDSEPSAADRRLLENSDLVISTGCVGYVTEKTFGRILSCRNSVVPPIVASFVLRMYTYDRIEAELAQFGLVTEKLEGVTFIQRRFTSQGECASTINRLKTMDIDPRGKESEGLLHAELFVSRTKEAIQELPLGDLISITNGEDWTRGRRFKLIGNDHTEFVH